MTPPKPPRKSLMMKSLINNSYNVAQPPGEESGLQPPATDENPPEKPPEARVLPVPRPRSKVFPKAQTPTAAAADKSATDEAQRNGESEERPRPVRPPARPPPAKGLTVGRVLPTVDRQTHCMSASPLPLQQPQPPAVASDGKKPRPERPPPPSVYYDRLATLRDKQKPSDESQDSTTTPSPHPESLNLYEENSKLSCDTTGPDCVVRPAVPPRHSQRSHPFFESGTLPVQSRPPPPSFDPPPPPPPQPSTDPPSDSLYSQIEHRPYLDVLPEDEETVLQHRRSTPRSDLRYQSGCFSSQQQTLGDPDDIIGMLRWLTRVSKSDSMTPSLYGLSIMEEIRSLNQRAQHVGKALRLYNLLMMKRNETLRGIIAEFHAISNSLDKIKKVNKTMGIAGGTTGAVGGMTAVLGIALAPVTMGASLIATAVGAGMVASAGGMGAHTAKVNKKTVNRMKVEKLVYEYKTDVVDVERCLDFVLSGMNELRRHDIGRIQRAGAEPDALKMAHLSHSVYGNSASKDRRASATHPSSDRLLQAFAKELDHYFTEENGQKMKKSSKSRFSGRVRLLAENLLDQLEYLNRMWEMFS